MPHRIDAIPLPFLTDEDFKVIGQITVLWAHAENQLESVLLQLSSASPETWRAFMASERLISFTRKIRQLKKLLRAHGAAYPEHVELVRLLLIRGSQISEKRKIVAHSAASRGKDSGITFTDMGGMPYKAHPQVSFSISELRDIAADVGEWLIDLTRASFVMGVDGPNSAQVTWHGPKPSSGMGLFADYPSLQNLRTPRLGTSRRTRS